MIKYNKIMFILSGIPGGGKTTIAEMIAPGIDATICCTDDFCMVDNKYQFDPQLANQRHQMNFDKAEQCCKDEKNVIIANTNCNRRNYGKYEELAKKYGYTVFHIYLKPNIKESIERNLHKVPVDTIKAMAYSLVKDFSENIPKKEFRKDEWKRKIRGWKNKIYYKYVAKLFRESSF